MKQTRFLLFISLVCHLVHINGFQIPPLQQLKPPSLSTTSYRRHAITDNLQQPYAQQQNAKIVMSVSSNNNNDNSISTINTLLDTITENPKKSIIFSMIQIFCGASLGPFLDSYHSTFGVLSYASPITFQLWSSDPLHPALITAWWVPYLFGLAGFIIGWLYILLDALTKQEIDAVKTSTPFILFGVAAFTFQYYLSGLLFQLELDRSIIFLIMSAYAYTGFQFFDSTKSGLITSLATAIGGPLIEVGLISTLANTSTGYHYNDLGETGFFPLWIIPVYFLGGPPNGNIARGVWSGLQRFFNDTPTNAPDGSRVEQLGRNPDEPMCEVCNDSRAVPCPNCDGVGYYMTYGQSVKCNCCNGRGLVICRECFHLYGEDPSDIESIREFMSRLPD